MSESASMINSRNQQSKPLHSLEEAAAYTKNKCLHMFAAIRHQIERQIISTKFKTSCADRC